MRIQSSFPNLVNCTHTENLKIQRYSEQVSRFLETLSTKGIKRIVMVLLSITAFTCLESEAQNSFKVNRSVMLPDYMKKHAHEVPPKSTQQRLEEFDTYIKYFSTLHFTRPGVTVSANFLRALISAESAANPDAVSNKNAIGLSQITPATGKIAARELYKTKYDFKYIDEERLKDLQPSDLFDPAINILICCYLIDKYNQDYNGNLALIISAWNAGPGSIKQYKGYPPYDETLTLIARVNSYYKYYMRFHI